MPALIDLHSHSTISDGALSPDDLIKHAHEQGVRVLALTDHDDTRGLTTARNTADALGIKLINGVEISVTWRKRTLHIIGLNVNPEHEALKNGLASIRQGRYKRAEMMAKDLNRVGIAGSLEGAYRIAGIDIHHPDGLIGRVHFARFLVEKGYVKDTKSAFNKYLVEGKPGYVNHEWATLAEAISWITDSGGQAVIAHPGRYDIKRTTMLELLQTFKDLGGSAIEVVTGSHTPAQYNEYAKYAAMFSLKSSIGSDYHGKGLSFMEMARLPYFPLGCVPVWQDWLGITDADLYH